MGGPKKAVRIGKVGTRIDRSAERTDCIGITPLRLSDKAMRKISPGFLGIARDRSIGPFSDLRKDRISILPTLKRTPRKADRA
jgi:hypothetical protein